MARTSGQSIKYNELAVAKIAKTKIDRQAEFTIEGVPGLMLIVRPTGVASWLVQYQVGKGPSRKRVRTTIGKFGKMKLADAREQAMEIVRQASTGVDAVADARNRNQALTLRGLFEARFAGDKDTAERTLEDYRAVLERDVFPELGNFPANEIKPEQLAMVLEGVAKRSEHAAHKARVGLGSTFKWGMRQWNGGKRLVTQNPTVTIGFTFQSERRKRRMTDGDLAKLWKSIAATESVSDPVRNVIRLAILTGQRNSEVAGMEVSELIGIETATPRWDIPAHRMKRKSDEQYVPLSRQALEIVRDALGSSSNGKHVFQGTTHGRTGGAWRQEHVAQESVSKAMRRIADHAGLPDLVLHDMRKVITSWLAEHGHATPEVLDAILHHGRKGVTGSHYNFALYEGQVRKALQIWADHVWRITGQAEVSNPADTVVPFGGRI